MGASGHWAPLEHSFDYQELPLADFLYLQQTTIIEPNQKRPNRGNTRGLSLCFEAAVKIHP